MNPLELLYGLCLWPKTTAAVILLCIPMAWLIVHLRGEPSPPTKEEQEKYERRQERVRGVKRIINAGDKVLRKTGEKE